MYTRCIFCYAGLGSNEAVERFAVGRRLAFDGARGRLWVVCPRCERWNLSPIEERWEAIEQCERLFRSSRLRVTTENIGLARLHEGLELVRIGSPCRPEFAGWRYGDQFGRRRRRRLVQAGLGLSALGAFFFGGVILGVAFGGFAHTIFRVSRSLLRGEPGEVVGHLSTGGTERILLLRKHLDGVSLRPADEAAGGWRLVIWRKDQYHELTGEPARRTLGMLLPHLNRFGGSARRVQDAVRFLEALPNPANAFCSVARMRRPAPEALPDHEWMRQPDPENRSYLTDQPRVVRLALEMAAHEEAEREALEGDLALLERSWREAEEVAAISDRLGVSNTVEQRLQRLMGSRTAER